MHRAKGAGVPFVSLARPVYSEPNLDVSEGVAGAAEEPASSGGAPPSSATAKVAHTTPERADELIRKHLAIQAKNSIAKDKKITGKARIVGEPDWSKAGIAHYGEKKWKAEKVDGLNGFVDKNGNVWVHQDRGNPATMIHEGVHKYSNRNLVRESQPLNEGATEYFTREIANKEGIAKARRNYQRNYKTTKALADLVGEDTLAKAYFDGDVALLKKQVDQKQGAGTWDKFRSLTKKNDWSSARKLLQPKK